MTSTTLTVPAAALGTWAWGDSGEAGDGYFGSQLSESGLREVVEKAQANGFTLWDTAVAYGMGRSETVLARALTGYDRSEYQLSTKFTPQLAGDGDDPVADMLEQSLDRLGTDYVDLFWIHNPADVARWTPPLIPLLESGKIKHVGVSNHNLEQIALADRILGEGGFRVEAVQNHYSLLYRSSERAGILEYCREHDVRFFSYMVLEQGALTGRYSPADPLPEGSSRAAVYNGILPLLQALTDRMRASARTGARPPPTSPPPGPSPRGPPRSSGSRRRATSTGWSEPAASSSPARRSRSWRRWRMPRASTRAAGGSTRCSGRRKWKREPRRDSSAPTPGRVGQGLRRRIHLDRPAGSAADDRDLGPLVPVLGRGDRRRQFACGFHALLPGVDVGEQKLASADQHRAQALDGVELPDLVRAQQVAVGGGHPYVRHRRSPCLVPALSVPRAEDCRAHYQRPWWWMVPDSAEGP
jgi:aryl-alcohol dehydrogenase-like predicted oxidoreductase